MQTLKNIGHSIDSGVSSVIRGFGGTIRIKCPHCQSVSEAAPDSDVECPSCHTQFHSPTFSERSAEVTHDLKEQSEQKMKSYKEEQQRKKEAKEGVPAKKEVTTTEPPKEAPKENIGQQVRPQSALGGA